MPSESLRRWNEVRIHALDEIESAHASIGGSEWGGDMPRSKSITPTRRYFHRSFKRSFGSVDGSASLVIEWRMP